MSIQKNGHVISTLEQWQRLAGPKSADQWVDDRSAKEVARAWLESAEAMPAEVCAAIERHPAFGRALSWQAEPEARLRFDDFHGEPRNSDLAVLVTDAHGPYLMAVEAKADEAFGGTIADTLCDAVERLLENGRSNGVPRVQQLAQALFGARRRGLPHLSSLRYQLLTACAGAVCEAERQGVKRALVLVHEFSTDKTADEQHGRNADDLNAFANRLSHGSIKTVHPGSISGPFPIPGAPLFAGRSALYIGKVIRDLRT